MRFGFPIVFPLALVVLGRAPAARAADCPSPAPTALDLDWSATDVNGFPRNPWWVAQATSGDPIDPADRCTCGGFPKKTGVPLGDPKCTGTASSDVPRGFHKLTCMLEWFNDSRTGVTRGHINWFPVVHTGYIWFENHSGADDDVNFELAPDSKSPTGGVPGQTKWNPAAGDLPHTDSLHVEMKRSETLDHLSQQWWKDFTAVSDDNDKARPMVSGARAVVIGLFGVDAEHKGHAESHPVYALAFRTACKAAGTNVAETWAVFVRNYGNEGWCSRWDQWHRLSLDNDGIVLQLPLDARARRITLDQAGSGLYANRPGASAGLVSSSGQSADLALKLPALGSIDDLRLHGEVKLSWQADARGAPLCAPPAVPELTLAPVFDEGEALVADINRRAAAKRPEAVFERVIIDTTPVPLGTAAVAPAGRTGLCPRNAAQCDETLRARTGDAFFPVPEAAPVSAADLTLCATAREMLQDYAQHARGALVDSPEGRKLRRLESLVSMCEIQEQAAESSP